ncbi:hypothetical protein SUDANB5_06762 [Streptomyces sp. SudanB5_2050]
MGSRVWLVTGAPGGLGQPLVSEVLNAGERVIAVSRDDKPLQPPASLDVIVNNAGYTLAGPFEELDDAGAARTDFRASWASRLPGSAALPDCLPVHDALARSADTAARQVGDPARTVQPLVALADSRAPAASSSRQ